MKREIWLDYIRAFACILVALGHLLMSFQEAAIKDGVIISYIISLLYHFHVYIFFFCSGFLFFISFSRYTDHHTHLKKKIIRCLDFLIVYIYFSSITYLIKVIFSGNVNTPVEHTLIETLLLHPINQMWYLYAIAIITLCTPVIKTDRECNTLLIISLILKLIICIPEMNKIIPVPLNYFMNNQIWFVLGIVWAFRGIVFKKSIALILAMCFLVLSTIGFVYGIDNALLDMILTFIGLIASVELFHTSLCNRTHMPVIWNLTSRYMFQIYLMHTICAAGIRIILLRMGISSFWYHFTFGILFSFAVPMLCAMLAERTKILNIIFYPSKTINYFYNARMD